MKDELEMQKQVTEKGQEEKEVPFEELSEEERLERARALLEEHKRRYRQRIEDTKARIRRRSEYQRLRRIGREYRYTVEPGDTLEQIARTFYAKPERAPEILEANADVISDPEHLEPGMELIIP